MTCKIKALKTCKWAQAAPSLPVLFFEKDKIYEIADKLAKRMIETNYAADATKSEKESKMKNTDCLNKMSKEIIKDKSSKEVLSDNLDKSDDLDDSGISVSKKNKTFSKKGRPKKYFEN